MVHAQAKVFAAIALLAAVVSAKDDGPTQPIRGYGAADCFGDQSIQFFADDKNLCWYHECVPYRGIVPRRCPLGTFIPMNYLLGSAAPCMGLFAILGLYDCTRTSNNTYLPSCYTSTFASSGCQNGGTPRWLGNLCWCDCPLAYQGAPDCSVLKGTTPPAPVGGPCPNGLPPQNFCASSPCKNNGICRNQCTGPVCQCRTPFTASKVCDAFTCDNNPCQNGGTCYRNADQNAANNNEFYSCTCPAGFTGFNCDVRP